MNGKRSLENISTKQSKIATLASTDSERALTTLAHHIDLEWLYEAYRRTRKNAAPGVDGVTATEYAENLDISKFFDNVDKAHLRDMLDQRVRDGVIRRVIGKWLKAGVMEKGVLHHPDRGTPQGGVISPLTTVHKLSFGL